MPLDQFNGYHLIPAMLVGVTPFFTRDDYEHYLSRLHALPGALQNMSDATRAGMEDALMPPKFLLAAVVRQAAALAVRGKDSLFAQPVAKFPDSIPEAEQKRLRADVLRAIDRDVAPAYERLAAFVKDEYGPKGRTQEANIRTRCTARWINSSTVCPRPVCP